MKSNLHSVLFETKSTKLWVANASKEGEPAANQPYHAFQLTDLLTHTADSSVPVTPGEPSATADDADDTDEEKKGMSLE
jgi:hypothetical protein